MFVKTQVIDSLIETEEKILIRVYGLKFIAEEKPIRHIKSIEDIFMDSCQANILKERINSNELDEIHIDDVIADSLLG